MGLVLRTRNGRYSGAEERADGDGMITFAACRPFT